MTPAEAPSAMNEISSTTPIATTNFNWNSSTSPLAPAFMRTERASASSPSKWAMKEGRFSYPRETVATSPTQKVPR